MAIKPANTTETAAPEAEADANVLDTQSAAVKRLIAKGKERGYITFDELNAVLPAEQNSSEQIEDIMAMLNEMGIQVVESEEGEEAEAAATPKEEQAEDEEQAGNISESAVSRTDDPVRMYLREMGIGGTALARGRDRHRQAHRGRARHDDPGLVRKPADLPRHHRLARGAE